MQIPYIDLWKFLILLYDIFVCVLYLSNIIYQFSDSVLVFNLAYCFFIFCKRIIYPNITHVNDGVLTILRCLVRTGFLSFVSDTPNVMYM